MSAVLEATCLCDTIGAAQEIRVCPEHHRHWYGDKRLTSYSRIINFVYPEKAAALAKIPKDILDHATERGRRVDRYTGQYALTGDVWTDPDEWNDVLERVEVFVEWFDMMKPEVVGVQRPAYDVGSGIVVVKDFDLVINGAPAIVELKCTASVDWLWKAQLGCQDTLSGYGLDLYVLHISPKLYKRKYKLIPYSMEECTDIWDAAYEWWQIKKRYHKESAASD